MDNKELLKEIEDRFATVGEEIVLDLDGRMKERHDKIDDKLVLIEKYLDSMVEIIERLVEKQEG